MNPFESNGTVGDTTLVCDGKEVTVKDPPTRWWLWGLLGLAAGAASLAVAQAYGVAPALAKRNPAYVPAVDGLHVVRLTAKNDVNGNPRRVFVVFSPEGIIAAVDEGYSGEHALDEAFGRELGARLRNRYAGSIETTSAEYRALRKNWPVSTAKFPVETDGDEAVLHFNAGNDVNGNPRRMFVVFSQGNVVSTHDEGYRGSAALPPGLRHRVAAQLYTTPAEYRRLRKAFGA